MKHITRNRIHLSNLLPTTLLLVFLLVSLIACKKEYLPDENPRQVNQSIKAKKNIMLESIMLNDTVVKMRCQNNLKQLGLAIHNYDGSLRKEIAYEYDQAGRLVRSDIKSSGHYLYENDAAGIIRRARFYPDNLSSPEFTAEYAYNANGDLATWQTNFGNGGAPAPSGGGGIDVLIGGRTEYEYNKDGSVRTISYYATRDDNEPTGKVILQYNVRPASLPAWKLVLDPFPDPEKPWDIITLLCTRIEMQGKGIIAGEEIIDGKLIEARNMIYNRAGFLLSKTIKETTPRSATTDSITLDYPMRISYTGLE